MQLLRDNLTLWTADMQGEGGNAAPAEYDGPKPDGLDSQ